MNLDFGSVQDDCLQDGRGQIFILAVGFTLLQWALVVDETSPRKLLVSIQLATKT